MLDPMCGAATILLEATNTWPVCLHLLLETFLYKDLIAVYVALKMEIPNYVSHNV